MAVRGCAGAAVLAAATLAGCTVGPDFHRPDAHPSPAYGAEPRDTPSTFSNGAVDERWWDSFHDPMLGSLVTRLLRQNLDLQSAAERVLQARAARRIAASQGLPRVEGSGRYTHERESLNGTASLVEPAPGAPLEFDLYQPSLQASWELDLFGRVRRTVEAANAQTEAAQDARRGVALEAVSDLAQTYLQLRGIQTRMAVVQDAIHAADARRKLVNDRYRNGVATLADVAQADAQGAQVAEGLPALRQDEARAINAIGLLLAEAPRALEAELKPATGQPAVPPQAPLGLPAELLRRRPDIREAEARLHAATAQTGVAVSQFYPQVTLTGMFGFESLDTDHLFDWASRTFMVGPAVTLPIFEGGRLKGNLEFRKSQEREAALNYRRTVLDAWRDVDDAMTAYVEVQHRRGEVQSTVDADRRALKVAEERYQQGAGTFIEVILAQGDELRAREALAQADTQVGTALVTLYRALGGGWSVVG